LDYARRDHWNDWLQWLAKNKDRFWPDKRHGQQTIPEVVTPELCTRAALSAPLQDPLNAMPLELARMVASGKMSPAEARCLQAEEKQDATTVDDEDSDEDSDDYSDSEDDDSDFDDDDDDFDFDQEEMSELMHMLSAKQ
jgi:hypothetical protein